MKDNNIKLYDFCNTRECDDQDNDKVNEEELPPFAVVSSNTFTKLSDGRMVRGRDYPWGTVNIENKVKQIFGPKFIKVSIHLGSL